MMRVFDGLLKKGDEDPLHGHENDFEVTEVGSFQPFADRLDELGPGEVGFIAATSRASTNQGRRHDHRARAPGRRRRCPATRT